MPSPLRLLFVCGSLEPGRDGVGDYSRRLAEALLARDYAVRLVATHDKQAATVTTELQPAGDYSVATLRIPYATPTSERQRLLQGAVDAFAPDWLSLQYVPHGFNKYGLPFDLLLILGRLRSTARRHVMFHELWITPGSRFSLKERLIHWAEQGAVYWLVGKGFGPRIVHTHLPTYRDWLVQKGANVHPLPLFANIAPAGTGDATAAHRQFRVAFFSQLATPPAVRTFLKQLADHLRDTDRRLIIELLGGNKERGAATVATLQTALPTAEIHARGFLDAPEVSAYLDRADLGITPVARHEIGKSGTVAAFLSHRLPVAAPVVTLTNESFFVPALNRAVLSHFTPEALQTATAAATTLDVDLISTSHIARTLIADLTSAAS